MYPHFRALFKLDCIGSDILVDIGFTFFLKYSAKPKFQDAKIIAIE